MTIYYDGIVSVCAFHFLHPLMSYRIGLKILVRVSGPVLLCASHPKDFFSFLCFFSRLSLFLLMHNHAWFCHTNISLPCSVTCDKSTLWTWNHALDRWTHFFFPYFVYSIYILYGGRRSPAESHDMIKLFASVLIWQLPHIALQLFHQTIVAGGKAISVALWDSAVDLMAVISRPVTTGWTSVTADRAMVTEHTHQDGESQLVPPQHCSQLYL